MHGSQEMAKELHSGLRLSMGGIRHRCRNVCLLGRALLLKPTKTTLTVHLGGSGGMPPRKIMRIWCSETPSKSVSSLKRGVLLVFIQTSSLTYNNIDAYTSCNVLYSWL